MIPTYDIDSITGNLDTMFQNIMKVGFIFSISLLTIWMIVSLVIWLFRSQKEVRKSNKVWNKEFYNSFNISNNRTNHSNIV
ncbi:MAG: hypothetical protein HFJ30_07970 [Clostridia bacterium]|jgi:hypothetical protein|nr:hypothetical protein [Clostridia bacterium]